jgi:hypothetical protein
LDWSERYWVAAYTWKRWHDKEQDVYVIDLFEGKMKEKKLRRKAERGDEGAARVLAVLELLKEEDIAA